MVLAVQSRQSYEFVIFVGRIRICIMEGLRRFSRRLLFYVEGLWMQLLRWGFDSRGKDLLLGVIGRGFGGLARYLLGRGVRPEKAGEENQRSGLVLHLAARSGDVDMVRLLLEYGVADIKDDKGVTAVQAAEERQYLQFVGLLGA